MHACRIRSSVRAFVALVAVSAALVACSSAAKIASPTTAAGATTTEARTITTEPITVPITDATTTTEAPTTTTPPVVTDAPTTTTTEPATTTTVPGPPVYPLTGVLVDDPVKAARPALIVKIDNAPPARPQTGFNEADIVVEEIVNDNLTRFAMIFQSGDSNPVGPIRSGRIQDINLFSGLNHPLFSWSGGNATVTAAINASDLVNIGPAKAAVYFRATDRAVPHNLYSSTGALWTLTPAGAGPPPQQFSYRAVDAPAAGVPSPGVVVKLDAVDVRWDWDAAAGLYRRTMEGSRHIDRATGQQVTTNNVIVFAMPYLPGISGSPDAQTIGTGEAFVLTGGNYIHTTWARADMHAPFILTADDGSIVKLQPGRTFIELPRPGNTLVIPGS